MRASAIVAANVLLTLEHLVVASLALGALSALPVWTLTSAAARGPWLDALLAFHLRILATFLAGVLIVLALRAHRREWFARAKLRDGPRVLLTLSMIVLASWAITSAATWLVRWREGVRLLDEGGVWNALRNGADVVSGSIAMGVLLLPGLLAATAASFLLVSAVTLLLLWAESGTLLRALMQGVLLGGAFLWGSFHALDLFDRVSELTAPLIEAGDAEGAQVQAWLRQNREQSAAAVESLRWQFVAYVGFGVAVVVMARSRISGDESEPEPRVAEWSGRRGDEAGLSHDVRPSATIPSGSDTPLRPGPATGGLDTAALRYAAYLVRPRNPWLGLLPGRRPYEISGPAYDPQERPLFRTAENAGETVLVEVTGERLLTVRSKGRLSETAWEVVDPEGRLLGTFERSRTLGRHWRLLNGAGMPLGAAEQVVIGLGLVKYELTVGGLLVASFVWRLYRLCPHMEVDFSPDPDRRLDRRLGLALAVMLESKVRLQAHIHSQ